MFGKNKQPEGYPSDADVFVMYDSKVQCYDMPMFAVNALDIQRQIMNVFSDPQQAKQNKYFLNSEDYSLFRIGAYYKKSGRLLTTDQPEHVANMHEIKALVLRNQSHQDQHQGIVPT